MTITEFLEARISEDEKLARDAIEDDGGHAGGFEDAFERLSAGPSEERPLAFVPRFGEAAARIITWATPRRVLAECAAKRAIIERHHPDRQLESWYWSLRECAECGGTWHKWLNNDVPTDLGPEQGCHTLRAIAAVYSDHPDYLPDWATDTP